MRRKTIIATREKPAIWIFGALVAATLFLFIFNNPSVIIPKALAATNINSTSPNFYAWSDVIGWIDFYSTGNVNVSSTQLTGYATSSVGYIALDCATSPNGNICTAGDNYKCGANSFCVSNDGTGNLAGWGYNDAIGWISFCGNNSGGSTWNGSSWVCPNSPTYEATVNSASGDFSGWAWNDTAGWICFNSSTCGGTSFKVNTSWVNSPISGYVISSTYDSFATSAVNTIMWNGTLNGGNVQFQIASSNSLGGLNDSSSYLGPDGTSNTYYNPGGPGIPIAINLNVHNNQRYFRYKLWLFSDNARTKSPSINSVIINYSP